MKTTLIWDIENISFNKYDEIIRLLNYTPDKIFVISKLELSESKLEFFNENNIKYIKTNNIADDVILNVLRITRENTNELTIVSSDSDFVSFIKENLPQYQKVNLVIDDNNKKRILMKLDITEKNLHFKIITSNFNKKTKPKKKKKKTQIKRKERAISFNKEDLLKHTNKGKISYASFKDNLSSIEKEDYTYLQSQPLNSDNISTISEIKKCERILSNYISENTRKIKFCGKYSIVTFSEWKQLLLEHETQRYSTKFNLLDICPVCKSEKLLSIENKSSQSCEDCEKLFVLENRSKTREYIRTHGHIKRFNDFRLEKNQELLDFGFIDYSKSKDLCLITESLTSKNIPIEFLKTKQEMKDILKELKRKLTSKNEIETKKFSNNINLNLT